MTGFINSLVDRFSGATNIISPRLPGRFEPAFPDLSNQLGESTIKDATSPVSNEINNIPSLKNTDLRFFDKNYYKDQLSKDENTGYSPIEKQKEAGVNPVDNEISSNMQQQENNTIVNTFIQPSGISNGNPLSFQVETTTRNEQKVPSASNIGDNAVQPGFLDRQLEKERQRGQVDKSQILLLRPEQYSIKSEEIGHPDLHEHAQSNKTPVIKVSIGRIEVRAVPVSNGVKVKDSSPQKPRLTLDEYLQKRNSRQ